MSRPTTSDSKGEVVLSRWPKVGNRRASNDENGCPSPEVYTSSSACVLSVALHAAANTTGVKDEFLPHFDEECVSRWKTSLEDQHTFHQLVRMLNKLPIFAHTPEAFRSAIAKSLIPVEYHVGKTVYRQGERSFWMGILIAGRLETEMEGEHRLHGTHVVKVGEILPGGVIGDIGLLGISETRTVTQIASQQSTLLVLERETFEKHAATSPRKIAIIENAALMQNLKIDVESFIDLECFKNLDRDFVVDLCQHLERRLFYPKSILMREANYGNEMFILHTGQVKVEKQGRYITSLNGGVVLGELAVLGSDKRRTATVIAETLSLVYVLHGDVFHEILDNYPHSKRIFDHAYVTRLVTLELAQAKDEMSHYDKFYGKAHPMTQHQINDQIYGKRLPGDSHSRSTPGSKASVARRSKLMSNLPALDPRRGIMQSANASQTLPSLETVYTPRSPVASEAPDIPRSV